MTSSGSNKPIRRERTPEWLTERHKEHEQTTQVNSSEAMDLEEQRRRLQEELKQYQKKK